MLNPMKELDQFKAGTTQSNKLFHQYLGQLLMQIELKYVYIFIYYIYIYIQIDRHIFIQET